MRLNDRAQESANQQSADQQSQISSRLVADGRNPDKRGGDAALSRAYDRARLAILWERLWPALAAPATAVGLFLAVSWLGLWLWLPPSGRAVGLCVFLLLAAAAMRAAPAASPPDQGRCVAPPRRQIRPAASAGDHDCGRPRGQHHRPHVGRALACPYGARLAGGQAAQGRSADAAPGTTRSVRAARAGPACW